MKEIIKTLHNKQIGFVPTMGALHLGHISLIQKADEQNDIVIVSIFVNPTQFGENEDLSTYPRQEESDIKICEKSKCDILFLPSLEEIYPHNDEVQIKASAINAHILEGASRDNHFDGVMQIVLKLFNLIKPQKAYFGKKDAQQLLLIQQLVQDLLIDIDIVACNIIREKDNLALSSRNIYLTPKNRKKALQISYSLEQVYKQIQKGQTKSTHIIKIIKDELKGLDIDYIEVIDKNMKQIKDIKIKDTIILIAITLDNKRYIDNLWL
jgi:pantoate--beta-alanine ligase